MRNKDDILSVLKTMIDDDIPALRTKIQAQYFTLAQSNGNPEGKQTMNSDQDFLTETVFRYGDINRVLTIHLANLMLAF